MKRCKEGKKFVSPEEKAAERRMGEANPHYNTLPERKKKKGRGGRKSNSRIALGGTRGKFSTVVTDQGQDLKKV